MVQAKLREGVKHNRVRYDMSDYTGDYREDTSYNTMYSQEYRSFVNETYLKDK